MKIDAGVRAGVVSLLSLFVVLGCLSSGVAQEPTAVISPSSHYVSNSNASRVIVFVHGLNGNARDTWLFDSTHYWPQDDSQRSDFLGHGYICSELSHADPRESHEC
jgi:hypothetical protein